MFAWCSISVSTTTSPSESDAPQERAKRLNDSVAFFVKTTSWAGSGAPMNRPTAIRACS